MQKHAQGLLPERVWGQCDSGQSGSFPRVLSMLEDFPDCRLLLDITADLACFEGHFPGNPVLAGVTQLHWAVCAACTVFNFDQVPGNIKQLKFKNTVVPPAALELSLNKLNENEVQFEFTSSGQTHAQGRLVFDDIRS